MILGRAIVAVVLALAVALLPAGAGAAFAAQTKGPHTHETAIVIVHVSDHATPCDHATGAVDDCASISVCALKCFSYTGTRLPSLAAPFARIRLDNRFTADDVDSRGGVPPFRPPRA